MKKSKKNKKSGSTGCVLPLTNYGDEFLAPFLDFIDDEEELESQVTVKQQVDRDYNG